MTNRTYIPTAIAAFVLASILVLFSVSGTAHANPLRFPPAVPSATATTTLTFMSNGAATSTLATYDSYANNGVSGGGSSQAMDSVAILLQTTASSTASVYWITFEYSMDGVDWYADNAVTRTTAGTINASGANSYSFTASSTAREGRLIVAPAPTRFIRMKSTVAGANGAIWGAIQPQKQSN